MSDNNEIKLFNEYDYSEVVVSNISLAPYICVNAKSSNPHTACRLNKIMFGKGRVSIVERFVCGLMRKGRNNGKKTLAMRSLRDAFKIINIVTGKNPIQILCDAIVNCGPREDSARVGRGGAMKRTSVDVSSLRRVNIGIRLLTAEIRNSAFNGVKNIASCISDVLLAAAQNSPNSKAVAKKEEIERIGKSNR